MAHQAILINGRPGAGKSTLAAGLAGELGCVALSKDSIKEALADAAPGVESALGAIAMDTVWALAAHVPDLVVVESWWFAPRDREFLARGLATAGVQVSVEVWCDVPVEVARARYERRRRHPVHRDDRDMDVEWRRWAEGGAPVALGPVVRVDTTGPVDLAGLAAKVTRSLTHVVVPEGVVEPARGPAAAAETAARSHTGTGPCHPASRSVRCLRRPPGGHA